MARKQLVYGINDKPPLPILILAGAQHVLTLFGAIPPIMTIIGAYKSMGPDVVMQYVGGSLIVGGVALSALGYGRLIGRIRKIITPVVIGPTIMAIGFSLAPTAIQFNAANFWPVSLLVVVLVFFFSLVSKNKYFNIFAVLGSIVIAYLLCLAPEHHRRAVAAPEPLHAVGRAEILRPRHRRYSGGLFLRND